MGLTVKGFLETSFLDWPGKVSSVIFLPGCNFRCPYCHNHQLVCCSETLKTISLSYIKKHLLDFKDWIDGIVISGGEPCIHQAHLKKLLEFFKKHDLLIKLDTNGSFPDVLQEVIDDKLIDAVSMDIKAPLDDIRYSRCTGVVININKIKSSIEIIKKSLLPYEFRITFCPSLLSKDDLLELAHQLKGIKKFTLQNFNPADPLDSVLKEVIPLSDKELKFLKKSVDRIILN
ncbi:MAG: anaerobic ribonucleoside-triphosphate reductase activating protein [bacterium]